MKPVGDDLLRVENLRIVGRGEDGVETEIVKGISLRLRRGEVLGQIG